jgi:hypothetical protein
MNIKIDVDTEQNRIVLKAKKEVFDDIEKLAYHNIDIMCGYILEKRTSCVSLTEKYDELKKKHLHPIIDKDSKAPETFKYKIHYLEIGE